MPQKQNKKKPHHKSADHAGKRHGAAEKSHTDHDDSEEVIETKAQADHAESDETFEDQDSAAESNLDEEAEALHADSADDAKNTDHSHDQTSEQSDDVKLDFPYSELVRSYAPKAMDVAEKVATDWKKDGSFMNLGIDNPYANMAVSMGLKKAKEIEKKLDEKGVLSVVRMGVEVLKQQVNKKK